MTPYADQTISDLETIISQATAARNFLRIIYAEPANPEATAAAVLAPEPRPAPEPPPATVRQAPRPAPAINPSPSPINSPAGPGRGLRPNPQHVAFVAKLPEPFTRQVLSAGLGLVGDAASQLLNRMKERGWVESPSRGLWRRTSTFGEAV